MAARFRRGEVGRVEKDVEAHEVYVHEAAAERNVTAGVVDQAVSEVLSAQQLSGERAEVIRNMLAADSSSAVAQAYFNSVATGSTKPVIPFSKKPILEIPYVLNEAQVSLLSAYAPDFNLKYFDGDNHDHPMAAACRLIDRKLVTNRIPKFMKVSDVGGSVVPLILSGELGTRLHTCAPVLDAKDPSRRTLARLRASRLSKDMDRSLKVRESAKAYLRSDPAAICNRKVQDCTYQTPAITSIHVYDVPIGDWAKVMEKKGASLLEGCMLFPEGIFEQEEGVMKSAGARFECDANKGYFRMGFVDSPSWWYEHNLSEYLKYGVDQMLYTRDKAYSYKIVERRGDTIFFRILQVACNAICTPPQHYRVPGIPMVEINGFAMESEIEMAFLARKQMYRFPAVLWTDMLSQAKDMVERNTLSHERLFNYYRTVSPRHSINAVVVSGGTTVDDLNGLVPLVVHVVFFALLEVARVRTEIKTVTDDIAADRSWHKSSSWYRMGVVFGEAICKSFKLSCYPFKAMSSSVSGALRDMSIEGNYDWSFVPEIKQVSAKAVLPHVFMRDSTVVDNDVWVDEALIYAPADLVNAAASDPKTAQLAINYLGDALPQHVVDKLTSTVQTAAALAAEEEENQEFFDAKDRIGSAPKADPAESVHAVSGVAKSVVSGVDDVELDRRRASIIEAIGECDSEANHCEASCAHRYMVINPSGREPIKSKIRDHADDFHTPDFWWIEDGLIMHSVSGAPVDSFHHSAIFIPADAQGKRLHVVQVEAFNRDDRSVKYHCSIAAQYTGWGYTDDSLVIYNGPAITKALRAALGRPLDFEVELQQGPPGCGKTTAIIKNVTTQDVILVPVRKAALETAERWANKAPKLRNVARVRVKTLDSFLVNYERSPLPKTNPNVLLADEAFMTREGRWLAAAALLGVKKIMAFGDRNQIPHVVRAGGNSRHVQLHYFEAVETFVTYRCPAELVACWGSVYDHKVRSASKVEGVVKLVADTVGMDVPDGCVMMGMYQSDKLRLANKYANVNVKIDIMTVHESQGNTYEHVWLHRFDKRTSVDCLYDKVAYALVAMSRSTKSFVYETSGKDTITKWIEAGKDPRRVNAVRDVESAGESIEFA